MFLCLYIFKKNKIKAILISIILATALNVLFHNLIRRLDVPFFFDTIFTIIEAALFGYIPALTVGFLTNVLMEWETQFSGLLLPFAAVNMLSGLVTAFMIRKKQMDTPWGAILTLLFLTLVNALAGAFIVTLVFGGITGEPVDNIVRSIIITGRNIPTAAFLGRIFVNIVDKGVAIVILFPLYQYLKKRYAHRLEIHEPPEG